MNAKDFVLAETAEIIQICNDLQYINNKELRIKGLMQIEKLTTGIEEHLEYLDIIEVKEDKQ